VEASAEEGVKREKVEVTIEIDHHIKTRTQIVVMKEMDMIKIVVMREMDKIKIVVMREMVMIKTVVMREMDMIKIVIASILAEALWVDVSKRLTRKKEIITTDLNLLYSKLFN
jgi:hypothetical protein